MNFIRLKKLILFLRFLSTLERHFKNVTHGATFRVVTETIPKMMSALRMVWIISRHYNRDERMVPLMERIANQLCDRVARSINIRTLFSYQPSEIIEKCTEAKDMLERWKQVKIFNFCFFFLFGNLSFF